MYRWIKRIRTASRRRHKRGERLKPIPSDSIDRLLAVPHGIPHRLVTDLAERNDLVCAKLTPVVIVALEFQKEARRGIPGDMDDFPFLAHIPGGG